MSKLYSFQGRVEIGIRGAGGAAPTTWTWVGDASEVTLEITADTVDHIESFSGQRGVYGSMVTQRGGTLNMTLHELETENLAIAFQAVVSGDNIPFFTMTSAPERWVKITAINTIDGEEIVFELYRVQFNPVTGFSLTDNEFGGLQLSGKLLYDSDNADDATFGPYGRIVRASIAP